MWKVAYVMNSFFQYKKRSNLPPIFLRSQDALNIWGNGIIRIWIIEKGFLINTFKVFWVDLQTNKLKSKMNKLVSSLLLHPEYQSLSATLHLENVKEDKPQIVIN